MVCGCRRSYQYFETATWVGALPKSWIIKLPMLGWTGVSQSMALPVSLVTDQYFLPHYDYSNTSALYNTIPLANVDTVSRNITVTIGRVVQGAYIIAPSQSQVVAYPGLVIRSWSAAPLAPGSSHPV